MIKSSSIIECLRFWAESGGERTAFIFLQDGENESEKITFYELFYRAERLSIELAKSANLNDRAVLIYSPGIDFIVAFYACLFAEIIAIPLHAPRRAEGYEHIDALLSDCAPALVLTDEKLFPLLAPWSESRESHAAFSLINTKTVFAANERADVNYVARSISSDQIAFLQYTSGSTGQPKGVCVLHANIIRNSEMITHVFGHTDRTVMVSWLPHYHDMGLIGSIIQPVYAGFICVFMPPAVFLQKPMRWIKAISKYKGTSSGGPNFAYMLCVEKYREEELEGVDISSWEVAYNGAEPIRKNTLSQFYQTFKSYGFRYSSQLPCYGMAEATLLVAGKAHQQSPTYLSLSAAALAQDRVQLASDEEDVSEFVSCGLVPEVGEVVIADLLENKRCQADQVGEVCIGGSHVTRGYWNRPENNKKDFFQLERSDHTTTYYRTGDKGFIYENNLYICGRKKDLVIVNGKNIYPHDIEALVSSLCEFFQPNSAAAFSIDDGDKEKVIVVQEIKREFRKLENMSQIVSEIKGGIVQKFGINLHDFVVVMPHTIPKTSSGKVKRSKTKQMYTSESLNPLFTFRKKEIAA